ncbi:MAG TPA: calcium/sodium antiporter [Candidatus Faecicola pullistercoris]|nr:calcium/sodium antiporter [Candidatus Faecicola pullistercoris]
MDGFLSALLLAMGILIIVYGGDLFVNSAIWIAKKTGVSEMIIGATVVSLGTTLPELSVSLLAIVKGGDGAMSQSFNQIAVGNALGSMLCNIGLVLALVMCVKSIAAGKEFFLKGIYLMAVTVLLTVFISINGQLGTAEGIVLLALFAGFIALNIVQAAKKKDREKVSFAEENASAAIMIISLIMGAAGIAFGANLLVDNSVRLSLLSGISPQIMGVTAVALGTSMPELVTAVASVRKKSACIGLGNILGANIINGTLLLGTAAVISEGGLEIDAVSSGLTVFMLTAITAVMVLPAVLKKKTFRWQGYLLLALYSVYITLNVLITRNVITL